MPNREEIKKFSLAIEELATKLRCDYHEAIIYYCQDTGLEVEVAAQLVSNALKAKIRDQAENLNLIKKTSKLPI